LTENAETSDEEPHPKLGQLETSEWALPVMHVFWAMLVKGSQTKLVERAWNVRLLKLSRLEPLPKELAQEKPPKLRPPYWEKDPKLRPLQSKPEDC
jgi:hypothetical protein